MEESQSLSKSSPPSESSAPSSAGTAGDWADRLASNLRACDIISSRDEERVAKQAREHCALAGTSFEAMALRDSLRQAEAERDRLKQENERLSRGFELWQSEWGKKNNQLTALQASRDALVKERDGLVGDKERLDWLLEYITGKGLNGLKKLPWTVYDEEGESLMHRQTINEDEVGDIRFDRRAIDAARASIGQTGGEQPAS